jgi:hypothetical protein
MALSVQPKLPLHPEDILDFEYWLCKAGGGHYWIYQGNQKYRCQKCGVVVSKAELKANTEVI